MSTTSTSAPPRPPREGGGDGGPPSHRRATYFRMPRRRRAWPTVLIWSLWAVLGVGTGAFVATVLLLEDTLEVASPDTPVIRAASRVVDPVLPGEPLNILLIGSDKRPGKSSQGDAGRSDSLILIRMDSRRGFISMLSFPRDLYVPIPGAGTEKINAAYSLGGPEKTIETVKALTGQKVNFFINIDFAGFTNLVDAVGGVYIDVDRRYFNDNSGPGPSYATIDLQPGYQRLGGNDALDYVRYRHTDSDFARIARQQAFLSEMKRQAGRLGSLPSIPSFAKIFGENIQTNLKSVGTLLEILQQALTTDKDRVARVSISGYLDMVDSPQGGISIVRADQSEIANKVDEWLNPQFESGGPAKAVDPAGTDVLVLNGNGVLLGAEEAVAALRTKRFRARAGGNADSFGYRQSAVYYAPGQREAAKAVQTLLGPGASIAPLAESRDPVSADVVVVTGADFTGELYTPPKPTTKPLPQTVDTSSLVPILRRVQSATGMSVMVPLKVARGSQLRRVRVYRVNTGGTGPWATRLVFDAGGPSGHAYWGIEEVQWGGDGPPLLEGRTGIVTSGGRDYYTFYDGKNLARLAWRRGDMTYWVSNSLDYRLSAETMYAIAKSARTLDRAKLPRGTTDTAIPVEIEGSTP
jgi:LCP family protein required for cell wall assembly